MSGKERLRGEDFVEFMAKMAPTQSVPETLQDLVDQRRERLAGGEQAVHRLTIAKWLIPEARNRVLGLLDKAADDAGAGTSLLKNATNFVREKIGGKRSPLDRVDWQEAEDIYRRYKAMTSITTMPQTAIMLGTEANLLAIKILNKYDVDALAEMQLLNEIAAACAVPVMQWQVAHGYVEAPDKWERFGRPRMSRATAGARTVPANLGKVRDERGSLVDEHGRSYDEVARNICAPAPVHPVASTPEGELIVEGAGLTDDQRASRGLKAEPSIVGIADGPVPVSRTS